LNAAGEAQTAANRGQLVVVAYRNHHDDKPGHIAIVRPSERASSSYATMDRKSRKPAGTTIATPICASDLATTRLRSSGVKRVSTRTPSLWPK
jgi:hypothetical protein